MAGVGVRNAKGAGRGSVLERGQVALAGSPADLLANPQVQAAYLGRAAAPAAGG